MNKWHKFGIAAGITGSAAFITYLINRVKFSTSVSFEVTQTNNRQIYNWRFGDISYSVKGSGTPLLLIHDLTPVSGAYEWNKVFDELAKDHTVYAIDLIGCGYSSKPSITYTAYLYVQLIEDFIKNIIGRRTDVIVTGDSAPIVIMACHNNDTLFYKLILINPENFESCSQIPGKRMNIFRKLLNTAIIGNSIYNMSVSKNAITELCQNRLFCSKPSASVINALHETAHLGGFGARHLYASTRCHYTSVNINKALAAINNSIFIIAGDNAVNMEHTIEEYIETNPVIESAVIPRSRHLPQLERPARFINQLRIFL